MNFRPYTQKLLDTSVINTWVVRTPYDMLQKKYQSTNLSIGLVKCLICPASDVKLDSNYLHIKTVENEVIYRLIFTEICLELR